MSIALYPLETMIETLTSANFLKIVGPFLMALLAWLFNEKRKREWEQYQRKVESYKELLRCLKGFYDHNKNSEDLNKFLTQLNLCWMYCPDEVIRKGYIFLDTVNSKKATSNITKEEAMGNFLLEIRKDLLSRKLVKETSLTNKEFKHLRVI